jgi:hypothetical protein
MSKAGRFAFEFTSPAVDVSTTGLKYTTAGAFGHRLGALQALLHKRGEFRVHNTSDATVTVALLAGGVEVDSLTLSAGAAAVSELDVAGISGAAALTITITVDASGTGTGQVLTRLDVEPPVTVSSC